MRSRFRSAAALIALLTLSLFWVEGVWASMCAQETRVEAASMADMGAHPDSDCCAENGESRHREGKPSGSPHCPLIPPGAASCIGGVAMLSSAAAPVPGAAGGEVSPASSDHARELLLAVSLLRPPRA